MIPLRPVIDTNIIISVALKTDGHERTVLLLAITKPARLYVTNAVLAEYREVLARPELKISRGLRQQPLQLVKNNAQIVKPLRPLQVAKDPGDNKFLECADAARAEYLLPCNQRRFPKFGKRPRRLRRASSSVSWHSIWSLETSRR